MAQPVIVNIYDMVSLHFFFSYIHFLLLYNHKLLCEFLSV